MLSSRAAYEEAIRPLNMARADIGNWSDVEIAALNLAIQQAASACLLRDPLHVDMTDLVDLARLCGVGQKWELTMLAAHRYIGADLPTKPQLTQAYAYAVEAELRQKMGSAALQTAQEMLANVPYDGITSGAYNMALDYLQFVDTHAAVQLGESAQPLLLSRLQAMAPASASSAAAITADPANLPAVQAYKDALRLPALQIYLGHFDDATKLAADVESALPAKLASDDKLLVAAERRRFALLGHKLPPIDVAASLDPQNAPVTELPLPGLATAMLLFPDWCAQCIRMGSQFPEGKFTVGGRAAVFYALLAPTRTTTPANTVTTTTASKLSAADQLQKTPTLLVPAATLFQLESTEYPLLLLVDENGLVRLHQVVGEDALQSGSTMDSALASLPGPGAGPAKPVPPTRQPVLQPPNHHSPTL